MMSSAEEIMMGTAPRLRLATRGLSLLEAECGVPGFSGALQEFRCHAGIDDLRGVRAD